MVQKVALQINCKLGGELWACDIPMKHLMVVGVDVYHDITRRLPSIAGIVSSTNAGMSRWYSSTVVQASGQELIDLLKSGRADDLEMAELESESSEDKSWFSNKMSGFKDLMK